MMQGGSAVVLRSDVGWVVVGDGRGLRSGGRRSVREEGSVRVRRAERLETDPAGRKREGEKLKIRP